MSAPTAISPFRLSSLLRIQKDAKLALQLFQNPNPNSNPQKPFRYTLLSYDLIITKLGRAKMFDQMEEILRQLKNEKRFAPKEIIFCNVINFYGRAGLPDRALQMFDEMSSFRCQRTVKSVNSLLNALLKCKRFDKMREIFVGIKKYDDPDACTYNILIHGCCLSGCLEDAWTVFDFMRKMGVPPNEVTLGTLMYGLCMNLRLKEAFKLKNDMLRDYSVRPNVYVYASLIKGLCEIRELSLAFKLKEEMVRNKVMPDSAVYSTLISALFKVGRKGEVSGVLEEMSKYGCKPDTVTYNAMINGYCEEKDFESAYRVLDEMAEGKSKPDVISYNVIIGGLCEEGRLKEANDSLEDMRRHGCAPDVVSYRILFDGLCGAKQFKKASLVLDEMIFKGYGPRCGSVHKLLDGLRKNGNFELLQTVLNSLGERNLIDADSWKIVISKFFRKDNLPSAHDLVNTLILT